MEYHDRVTIDPLCGASVNVPCVLLARATTVARLRTVAKQAFDNYHVVTTTRLHAAQRQSTRARPKQVHIHHRTLWPATPRTKLHRVPLPRVLISCGGSHRVCYCDWDLVPCSQPTACEAGDVDICSHLRHGDLSFSPCILISQSAPVKSRLAVVRHALRHEILHK